VFWITFFNTRAGVDSHLSCPVILTQKMTEEFTEIYLRGEPKIINRILEIAKDNLGDGIRVIDLHPEFKELK